jgi:hypothetical protein
MPPRSKSDPRWLNGLYVCPLASNGKPDEDFNLKLDNWRRRAKVPNLILNTTSLNTGHNWQFTASWTGEPPAGIDNEIDGNDRLRRLTLAKTRRKLIVKYASAAARLHVRSSQRRPGSVCPDDQWLPND